MKTKKNLIITLVLAITLAFSGSALAEEESFNEFLGQEMFDFTVDTIDGGSFTLSEALKDHDMVLINMWATWCGPCRMEFPYMEAAWENVQDEVAIIAVSVDEEDDMNMIAEFAEENGLTFNVGSDTAGLADYFQVTGIPTSVVIDRFGNIAWMDSGAITSQSNFDQLFASFIGDDYTETTVLDEIPALKPNIPPASEEELAEALGAEGSAVTFMNDEDDSVWPMLPEEDGDRLALKSSNAGLAETESAVKAKAAARAGDVLVFDYKTSLTPVEDMFYIYVDGEQVKAFGGEHEWSSYAVPLEEGEHEITFSLIKNSGESEAGDAVWLDNVCLKSGEEAEEALAANPVYLTTDEVTMTILNEGARQVVFDDPDNVLWTYFLSKECWVLNDSQVQVLITVTEDYDPEEAFAYCDSDALPESLASIRTEDGYLKTAPVDSLATSGYSYTDVYLYPSVYAEYEEILGIMVFADEENLEDFAMMVSEDGVKGWHYLTEDEEAGESDAAEETSEYFEDSILAWRVYFVDEQGEPVPGAIVNFCTDVQCTMVTADDDGLAEYIGEAGEYHVQVLKVPAGYNFDKTQEFYLDPADPTVTIILTGEEEKG